MIAGALSSFISQGPSFEFVGMLEDYELLDITHTDFYRLVKNYPGWKTFYVTFLEWGSAINMHWTA
jgi:hypothetical protein